MSERTHSLNNPRNIFNQHYYNRDKTENQKKGFEEILHEMVLELAGIKKFLAAKPEDMEQNFTTQKATLLNIMVELPAHKLGFQRI